MAPVGSVIVPWIAPVVSCARAVGRRVKASNKRLTAAAARRSFWAIGNVICIYLSKRVTGRKSERRYGSGLSVVHGFMTAVFHRVWLRRDRQVLFKAHV